MADKVFEKLKFLYEKSGMSDKFISDLDKGVIAKINVTSDSFPYSKYAQLSTSIFVIDCHKYQYFIFKSGYYYKNRKLHCENNINDRTFDNNLSK